MEWIFWSFLLASLIHMGEEYFYPGGFMDVMKRLNPALASFVTVPMAVIINGLQLVLCICAVVAGESRLTFSMSIAGLLVTNGVVHILGCLRVRGYAPGVITGILLYIPLSLYAYHYFVSSRLLTADRLIASVALGLGYQAVPIIYLTLARMSGRHRP